MSESKFLPFQDADGDLHNDKCKIDDIVVEAKVCSDCTPNESAIVPDWKTARDPYLNEKNCKYQIGYKTDKDSTGYETGMSDTDAEETLNGIYEDFAEEAITELLEFYNKETTVGAIALVKESFEYTDYDLLARYKSRLKLLYSVPADVLNAIENADDDTDEEDAEESGDVEVTYQAADLEEKILRVRKGLKLYNRYYSVFSATSDEVQRFKYTAGPKDGAEFVLKKYGDFGLGINPGGNRAKLELVYTDLNKFLRERGYSLRPSRSIGFKEPISEITLSFDSEYEIKKISFKTEKCGIKPIVYTGKLKILKKQEGWKDKTAIAYFAQLDAMDNDLQARTPKPWADFIIEYTYPQVQLKGINQALAGEQTAAGCVAEAIGNKLFDGSLFDKEFSISDALAAKWHDLYCNSSPEEIEKLKESLGINVPREKRTREERQARRRMKRAAKEFNREHGHTPVRDARRDKLMDLYRTAEAQAYESLNKENDPFKLLCLSQGKKDFDFSDILADLKICGLEAVLTQAITCLFGGLSLEQTLSKVAEAALKGMNVQKLNDLFVGLPPEQQAELNELAKKKLKEGDLFADDSTNQEVSDAIAGNDFTTLAELNERADEEDEDPNAKERTLAQKFDNPSSGANKQSIMQAYVAALLEYYADNFLELIDQLNRFPGARLISNAIIAIDCPRPPLFNPSVFDFIKDLELPFCRNMDDIALPKLVNPFAFIGSLHDILAILFEVLKKTIAELIIAILVKLLIKICDIIGSAVCKALEIGGSIAAGLATSGGMQSLSSILRDAVCGDSADQDQVNNSIVEMFANFGVGAEAFANQEQTLALAETMANVMTQQELASAFLGDMSVDASQIIVEVINSEFPDYSEALSSEDDVAQMFSSMGEIFPAAFRETLGDMVDQMAEDDPRPVNPSICATDEQLEEFCSIRQEILDGRASPEQIAKLCEPLAAADDLGDLQSVLDGGIGNYIADNMPPITSDPGCDNGLLPYEPEETINATTAGLGNDLEMLMVDYSTDMIGNGLLEKKWGMVNMIMSDTEGNPLTTHIRKANINPFYVDEYGSFFPDPKVIAAAGLASPVAFLALNALDQSNRNGAYPTKVAAYLQIYMNGEIEDIVSVDYNNTVQEEEIKTIAAGETAVVPFVSDSAYETTSEYIYSSDDGEVEGIEIIIAARKAESDITLSYSDYANGLRRFSESEYEYGFDIEAYTAEVEVSGGITVNIYSDNMRIKISDRINLASFSLYGTSLIPGPSFAAGFDIGSLIPDEGLETVNPFDSGGDSESNSDLNVDTTVRYQFLSVDDTFTELEDELEQYTSFQSAFTSEKEQQPQNILLQEIIENETGTTINIDDINTYRSEASKTILNEIYKVVADTESEISAWHYGAEAETLATEDTDYGINDNGTWVLYKDTGLTDEDMTLGISYDQYKNEVAGTLQETRVFYLNPAEFGGTYKKPGIYIKPPPLKGWFGLIDALFPEYSPCKPQSTNLVDFDSIKDKIDELYPNIPEDERLKSDPDCIVELPYNRVLERPAKAAMVGLIIAACRIYASAHIIKTLPTFAQFSPRFPEVFSSAYASYIIEDMQDSFKNARGADWELFNGFSDEDFWYGFLEQCVQMYSYRVDIGDVEPPLEVLKALLRLNDAQQEYEYPKSRAEVRGDIGLFQSLKNYRREKNLEVIKQTQDDAKIVMKEWIVEQLNYMSQKLITNLENIGFAPEVKDISYYMLEQFTAGTSLTINQTMDSFGLVEASYGDLPTIPYDDNDDAAPLDDGTPAYYTYGGELVVKESAGTAVSLEVGQEYVGAYHVHLNEMGDVIYMAGEQHTENAHDTLTPISNIATVAIGDISEIGSVTSYGDSPFLLEKYISIDGTKMTTSEATSEINSNSDLTQLISDVYPGTMELVYSGGPRTADLGAAPVGIKGELGVRYGLRFSCIIGNTAYEITSVEIDALDLSLTEFKTLSANSLNLYCLVKELKEDPKFKMVSRYIVPMNKLTAMTAIYNDMALLPSIGQLTVEKKNLFTLDIEEKLNSSAGMLPTEVNTILASITVDDLDLDRPDGAWDHPDDRKSRKGLFVLSWDNWSKELLINSTSRMKKLFKTYYNSRDFDPGSASKSENGPGKIFGKSLKDIFRPAPGRQLLPWFMKRKLKDNPFNSLGEICKKEDA